jgi:hypothetical protein
MLSLRNRFGIPGVISVIALVFAMLGGAYAASNNGGGKATASAKAKRGPKGPKGATGPAGPAGLAGPQGAAGANGKDGAAGSAGAQGSQGLPGKSVAVANYSGPECPGSEEGATVEVSGEPTTKKYVCDGEEGAQGPQGSPWTAGGTLPAGATETGAWAYGEMAPSSHPVITAISFPIPLAAALNASHVHYINPAGEEVVDEELNTATPTQCGSPVGTASEPKASPGNLCVYAAGQSCLLSSSASITTAISTGIGARGASKVGARLRFAFCIAEPSAGSGTWAVTG